MIRPLAAVLEDADSPMSNAPSMKEPSMEEILASIRRIIESGDDRSGSVLKTDILHDEPANEGADDNRARLPVDSLPHWEASDFPRDFAPANGDRLSGIGLPIEDEPVLAAEEAESPGAAEQPAAIAAAEENTPFTAPASAASVRQAVPDADRHGLSLHTAYRRQTAAPVDMPAESDAEETAAASYDDLVSVEETLTSTTPLPIPKTIEVAQGPSTAAATSDADVHIDFDEEQFTSDLRTVVGFDTPATAPETARAPEPSVIAAASTLMSEAAGAQVAAAFDDLARSIRDGQMKSMEDMAREMLRPMLQEWLDDNLPRIVERMVREEIERVSRGPRR
jgi:cell pole-organizing protein PopZ